MNILFVTGAFASSERDDALGGMAGAVYKSAVGMKRLGHRVRVLAVGGRDRRWTYRGINVISVRARNGIEEQSAPSNFYDICQRERIIRKAVSRLHKEESIDIIQYTGWFGIGAGHVPGIPAVMRMSSYTRSEFRHNYHGAQRLMLEFVEHMAAVKMNFIFAPGRLVADGMKKDTGRNVAVIETPFLQDDMEPDDSIWEAKLKGRKYILFFGRMSVEKGIYTIRDILYRVLDGHKEVCFVFAGSSCSMNGVKVETELKNAARSYSDRVIFLGQQPREKLFPVIGHSELVLMPSLFDNFPNGCAEAMSMGKIVIGTNGSSLEQYIKDGENGFLAERGDADSLYDCVEKALAMSDGQKRHISASAVERVRRLDIARYSKKMERIYTRLIDKRKNNTG